ncbi:glycosyltransferase family 2 protein [Candidatus Fermentibacteria bacterium]|nr:glycosyltransferase family 2 protein [Candidatus Fermentibacteria bacterium]
MTVSAVVPARDAAPTLPSCLAALRRAGGMSLEILVVNDGSCDATASLAERDATRVITLPRSVGASRARNLGAREAGGEIVVFVDADVMVPPDAFTLLLHHFQAPDCPDAVQGIYAAECPHPNASSQYKNLYYHYSWTRRIKNPWLVSAASFFFAIRASLFRELGGFDERITVPTVEDADLGHRVVRRGGRILLDSRLRVIHDRHYGAGELLRYDFRLAAAKTRFMLRRALARDVAVLHPGGGWAVSTARAGEMRAWLGSLACLPLGIAAAWAGAVPLAVALGACVILFQLPFLFFISRRRGALQAGAIAALLVADVAAIDAGIVSGAVSFLFGKRY